MPCQDQNKFWEGNRYSPSPGPTEDCGWGGGLGALEDLRALHAGGLMTS